MLAFFLGFLCMNLGANMKPNCECAIYVHVCTCTYNVCTCTYMYIIAFICNCLI